MSGLEHILYSIFLCSIGCQEPVFHFRPGLKTVSDLTEIDQLFKTGELFYPVSIDITGIMNLNPLTGQYHNLLSCCVVLQCSKFCAKPINFLPNLMIQEKDCPYEIL